MKVLMLMEQFHFDSLFFFPDFRVLNCPSRMGIGVVNLFFLAAFVFSNPAPGTWGHQISTLQKNPLAGVFEDVSHKVVERAVANPKTDIEIVQEYLDRKVVEEKVRETWGQLMTSTPRAVTETNTRAGKRVTFENTGQLSLKEAFQYMQFYPLLYGEETKPTEFRVPIGADEQRFKLANEAGGTFSLKAVRQAVGKLIFLISRVHLIHCPTPISKTP